ncbi:MAG: hypothetical protein GXY36_00685 [Chloroflexi bacterium]|nr:hypothetical protein [Chloroflexota bacterium]
MSSDADFAARIAARYPEGLTGVIAVGGTRTAYILERRRSHPDPGQIEDYADYARYALHHYLRLVSDFFELGGRYVVVPCLSYQAFYERGAAYHQIILEHALHLLDDEAVAVYRQYDADPYFVGIDTLLHLPAEQPAHQFGAKFECFMQAWPYQEGRRKVLFEIAPIPLYSFWNAQRTVPADEQQALAAAVDQTDDMHELYRVLFAHYARAAFGTEIPVPHFYVGTNRSGDLKLRSMLPIALLAGGPFRLFYLSYPSLMMTREALRAIIEDVAFGGEPAANANAYDYAGQFSTGQVQAAYQHIMAQVADPRSILGFKRG